MSKNRNRKNEKKHEKRKNPDISKALDEIRYQDEIHKKCANIESRILQSAQDQVANIAAKAHIRPEALHVTAESVYDTEDGVDDTLVSGENSFIGFTFLSDDEKYCAYSIVDLVYSKDTFSFFVQAVLARRTETAIEIYNEGSRSWELSEDFAAADELYKTFNDAEREFAYALREADPGTGVQDLSAAVEFLSPLIKMLELLQNEYPELEAGAAIFDGDIAQDIAPVVIWLNSGYAIGYSMDNTIPLPFGLIEYNTEDDPNDSRADLVTRGAEREILDQALEKSGIQKKSNWNGWKNGPAMPS